MIPLIRSGAIMPFVIWMQANGRPVEDRLREVDLGYVLREAPDLPIPLNQAIAFLRIASSMEGPDFACRVVSGSSVRDLGPLGAVALGAETVRKALFRISTFLPHHTTHGVISAIPAPDGVLLREAWGLRMDDETRHMVQQYVAALIQSLCVNAGASAPVYRRVALVPHPVHGLAHLTACFGEQLEASRDRALELFVPNEIADRPLSAPDHPATDSQALPPFTPLRGDGTLSGSVRIVMASMLSDGTPTVERLSEAAGCSVRTLQRRLQAEGQHFSALLETVRRDLALADLAAGSHSMGQIAGILGYGQSSSLTRAVRRWTGSPPRAFARRDNG
jgi:AraC-like DNA-binding protein